MNQSATALRPAFLAELALAAFAYLGAALLGLQLASIADQVSVVWPATGVALALLVMRGRRLWPAITAGALLANLLSGAPPAAAAGIALGNTLEALLGATLLARAGFDPALKRPRDVTALLVYGAALSTVASATIGVASLCAAGAEPWARFAALWSAWWIGDAVGDLVVAPVIFTWAAQRRRGLQLQRLGETALLTAALVLLALVVFMPRGPAPAFPLHYLIFPAAIWAALRLGQHAVATLVFGGAAVAVWGTLAGRGPFIMDGIHQSLLQAQLFMAVVATTGLLLAAAIGERNRFARARDAELARVREGEARLALALAAGQLGAWEWDIESGRITWSEVVERIHGMAPGTFAGTFEAFRALIHPDDEARVLAAIGQAVRSGDDYDIEFRVIGPDGVLRWNAARGRVVTRDGRPVQMVGVCRDISAQRALEEERRRQAERLAEADRRKDEFLAVLAHELRNPLAPLQNGLQLLALRAADAALVSEVRAMMERQLRHLVRLVDDLLDVARIGSGKIVLNRERITLASAVDSAVELAQPLLQARRHRFTVSLPREPVWLDADATRLPQLLANLLNNAAKYTEEGGEIGLSAERCGTDVLVRVRDTGIGMTPETIARAFELFAQPHRTTSSAQGGLGIGLSLARSLAALHGGTLTAHSDGPGRGSEFVLRLPAAGAAAHERHPQPHG